jgi:egghead protein (zeste-white 4 protein)
MHERDDAFYRRVAARAGVPFLETVEIGRDAAALVPPELCRALRAAPYAVAGGQLLVAVATADHGDVTVALHAFTGLEPSVAIAHPDQIEAALAAAFGERPRPAAPVVPPRSRPRGRVSADDVDVELTRQIGTRLAHALSVVALKPDGDEVPVATTRRLTPAVTDAVSALLQRPVRPVLASPATVSLALERAFSDGPVLPRPPAHPVVLGRELDPGIGTLAFRLWAIGGVGLTMWALFWLQGALWGEGRIPSGTFEELVSWLGVSWAVAAVPAASALVGLLLFRKPEHGRRELEPIANVVSFRVVARGQNSHTLRSTIAAVRRELARLPLFPYVIEVVTDLEIDLGGGDDLVHYVVPPDYRTGRGTLWKARALQYALERSPLRDDSWIMHLDEESHPTASLVVGIYDAVREEEATGRHRIGQGTILYNRDLRSNILLTLADSIRTGDDVGRFHFQHRVGRTLFGLHGSFILVRTSVERATGFDFGAIGSITEDAFWALLQMAHGRQSRWVDGYVVEQAPRTLRDFVKQRRRWFVGLAKVVTETPVPARHRLALGVSTAVWSLAWLGIIYFSVILVTGFDVPEPLHWAGNFGFAVYIVTYVLGLRFNLDHMPSQGALRTAALYAAQVALIPLFALFEAIGVVYGFARPEVAFHVIRK